MQSIRAERAVNLPNALTLMRIALLPFIAARYIQGDARGALFIYLLAMLTDVADGMLARRLHQITSLGKLLDPLADKLSLLTLLMLFAWTGQISAVFVRLILMREGILIAGSIAALRAGIVVSALPVGKVTTVTFVISMVLRFLSYRQLADLLLWFSVLLSLAGLLWYSAVLAKRLQQRREEIKRQAAI